MHCSQQEMHQIGSSPPCKRIIFKCEIDKILRRCFEVTHWWLCIYQGRFIFGIVLHSIWLVLVLSEPSFQVFIIGQKRSIVPPAPDLSRKFIWKFCRGTSWNIVMGQRKWLNSDAKWRNTEWMKIHGKSIKGKLRTFISRWGIESWWIYKVETSSW